MLDAALAKDIELRKELVGYADHADLLSSFESRYGRGWQRKLATALGVPETTVNGWIKAKRFPPLAKLAFGMLLSDRFRQSQKWVVVKARSGYSVCSIEGRIGRVVAENIEDRNNALLMAASPALRDAAKDASWWIGEGYPSEKSPYQDLADALDRALDAAVPLSTDTDEEEGDGE